VALKKQIVSTPPCLVILINLLFGNETFFDTKLYFTCILILEVEKEKRNSSKNYKEKRKLVKASKVSARKNNST
jgi:predicted metal-dependent hydrolase